MAEGVYELCVLQEILSGNSSDLETGVTEYLVNMQLLETNING